MAVTRSQDAGAGVNWRHARLVLLIAALVPLAANVLLRQNHVPLGCPGRFVYLYSPLAAYRLAAVPAAVLLAGTLAAGTWLASSSRAGLALAALGAIALSAWAYVAPPHYRNQHIFNSESPSQEGAFVSEALRVISVRDYLRDFPRRAQAPPAAMRGTRVISNPPGATLLAVAVERSVDRWPAVREWALGSLLSEVPTSEAVRTVQYAQAVGLVFFWVLTGLWVIAAAVLYGLARLFVTPVSAAAYALCCVFAPATLLLAPGKDPAQLLTVAAPLLLWLWAARRDRVLPAVLAGVTLPLVCLASLVHIWIAAIVVAATWLATEQRTRLLGRAVLPGLVGATLSVLGLYLLMDVNLIAIMRAVARAQAEVTRGPAAMPLAWQTLGMPLFLLFVGPAFWTTTMWTVWPGLGMRDSADRDAHAGGGRDAHPTRQMPDAYPARLGRYLLIGTAVVMLATVGFTNVETPRLWIPFTPLLLLGALLQLSALHRPNRGAAQLLVLLVAVQIIMSALQWSLMDIREAETRLVEQRFFG